MPNIDKRIVEMQFNNAQFEQGVKTSTRSLEDLKRSLDFTGVLSKFNIGGISSEIEETSSVFDRLRSKIPDVMKTAGKAMMGFGIAATGALTGAGVALGNLTIKGGITRAMNLKQADFMLQGLVKDEKAVKAIMEDVNDSVDGTAYSLDQAALVASQFAATGMRGGEEMNRALKGVAGTAAVFGADYQRVGQIFTQVSGQGRLMGNDLLQLSSMGMNAAATLADYFKEVKGQAGTTEADIRDMVSKSKIDFQTFADAMAWAFGDQAAKANETFTGALANLKSAFSRIGEKIASPVIDSLRDLFNAVRPLVNALNSHISPALESFGKKIGSVGDSASKFIQALGGSEKVTSKFLSELDFDAYKDLADYLKKVRKGAVTASDDITKLAKSFKKSDDITSESVANLVKKRKISFEALKKATDEGSKSVIANGYLLEKYSTKDKKASEALAEYFNEVNKGNIEASKSIKKTIKDLTDGKKITAETAEELVNSEKVTYELLGNALGKNIWESPLHDWSIFGTFIKGLKNIAWNVKDIFDAIKSAFAEIFPKSSIENVRALVDQFNEFTFEARLSKETLNNLGSTFKGIFVIIKAFGKGLKAIVEILKPVFKILGSFASVVLAITGRIGEFLVKVDQVIEKSGTIKGIVNSIKSLIETIGTVISSVGKGIASTFSGNSFQKGFGKNAKALGKTFEQLGGNIKNLVASYLPGLNKAFDKIGKSFSGLKGGMKGMFKKKNFSMLTDLFNTGLVGANTIAMKKFFDTLTKTTKQADTIKGSVIGIFDGVKGCLEGYQKDLKAAALIKIAEAIAIFAASIFVLSIIDPKHLATGLAGLSSLFIILFGVVAAFSKLMSNSEGFSTGQIAKLSAGLIGISIAVGILSSALFLLSSLSADQIIYGLAGIAGACIILVKVADRLGQAEKGMIRGSFSFVTFASALVVFSAAIRILGSMDFDDLAKGLGSVIAVLGALALFISKTNFDNFKATDAAGILVLSAALVVLTGAVAALGHMNIKSLGKGIGGLSAMLVALAVFTQLISKQTKPMLRASIGLLAIGLSLSLFIAQLAFLARMKPEALIQGLAGIASLLAMLVIAINSMPESTEMATKATSMYLLGKSLAMLATAISKVAGLDLKAMGTGLIGLAGGIALIIAGMMAINKIEIKRLAVTQETFLFFNYLFKDLAKTLKQIGSMSFGEVIQGILGLAGAMGVMIASMMVMQSTGAGSVGISAAILGMAAAIALLTPALVALSKIPLIGIGVALGAMAGTFLVFGAAAAILKPVIVPMMGLSVAVLSLGMSVLAAGAGIALFTSSLASLAILSAGSIHNIVENIKLLSTSIPTILEAVAQGIVEMVRVIGEQAALMANVALQLLIAFMTSINSNIYQITSLGLQIITNFINAIAANLGSIIQAGINLMVSFINGMANGIRENQDVILSAVSNLMTAIIEFILSALEALFGELPVVGERFSAGIEKIKQGLDKNFNSEDAKKTSQKYGEGLSSGLESTSDKAKKSGEKVADNAAKGMSKKDLFEKAATSIGDTYNSYLENGSSGAKTAGGKFPTQALKGMSKIDGIKGAGSKAGSSYSSALGNLSGQAKTSGGKFPTQALKGMGKTTGIKKAGTKAGTQYNSGLGSVNDKAKTAGNKLANKAKSGMGDVGGHYGLGSNAAAGFVSGAGSKNSSAYSAGWSLASSYYNAIKNRLKEKSPSKETYKLALYAVQGFVKPSYDYAHLAESAGSNISSAMLFGIKKNSGDITSSINNLDVFNDQPVIKPVVDMTGVYKASDKINGMFYSNKSLGTISAIGNINETSDNFKMRELFDNLGKKIDNFNSNSSSPTNYFTFNVDGSENPEVFANRFFSQLKVQMRTL